MDIPLAILLNRYVWLGVGIVVGLILAAWAVDLIW